MKSMSAHHLIVDTAKEMAGALYEDLAKDNVWYKQWRAAHPGMNEPRLQYRFIVAMRPKLIQQARTTLTKMLKGSYPQVLKDQIADALIKDASLVRGRKRMFRA